MSNQIDVIEYDSCGDCLIAIANDDYTGMDDTTEVQVKAGIEAQLTSAAKWHNKAWFAADGEDLGFSSYRCEICNALAGDRYRVNMLVEGVK
jgi:hypothetical protein